MNVIIKGMTLVMIFMINNVFSQDFQGIATYKTKRKVDFKMDSTAVDAGMDPAFPAAREDDRDRLQRLDVLLGVHRAQRQREVREAVMHGLMVAGDDESLLELFRSSADNDEKAELLRQLVIMDSDAAMQAIDDALTGQP